MKDGMTESDVSFDERSWDEEAGGPGSPTLSEVSEMQNLRRGGFSYRDIAEFVNRSVSTVFKWTRMITPETFFEPGLSLQEKLSRRGENSGLLWSLVSLCLKLLAHYKFSDISPPRHRGHRGRV